MSFFKNVMSGVKAIFGVSSDGADNVMKVATGVGNWIDEQQFTAEEKAKFSADTAKQFQQFMELTVKENTQRSITRRDIALWVIRSWFVMLFGSIVANLLGYTDQAEYIFKVATISELLYLVLGIGGFFFGAHMIRQTKLANPNG